MDQRRPLFVINPAAGHGRGNRVLRDITRAFSGPAEVVLTTGSGDAEDIACRGALEGYAPIVAVGGEGTLQEVVNGLMRTPQPPPVGIVPAGTGNDLVRTLGIPTDPTKATQLVWSDVCGDIDVAVCNGRYFMNVGGAGLDTRVAMSINKRSGRLSRGKLAYIMHGIMELSRFTNPEFVLHLDGQVVSSRSLLVAVANGQYFAGGMKICPDADPSDGLLDVCVAGDLSRREALVLLPAIFYGRHVRHPKVTFHRASTIHIEGPPGMEVQLDGEIVSALPAEFRVVPRALRIVGWRNATSDLPLAASSVAT